MSFKQQLQDDLSIFFNQNELSDVHLINNVAVNCILTDFSVNCMPKSTLNLNNQNLNVYDKELGIKTSDLNIIPANLSIENIITLDGITYKILSVSECEGLTTVKLLSKMDNLGLTITIKYRDKFGTGYNKALGIPGTKTAWASASTLSYLYFDQITQNKEVENFGVLTQGDVELRLQNGQNSGVNFINSEFLIENEVYQVINSKVVVDNNWTKLFLRRVNVS